jgi:THO complex subunit 7
MSIEEDRENLKKSVQARRDCLNQIQVDIQEMNRLGRENIPDDEVIAMASDDNVNDSADDGIKAFGGEGASLPESPSITRLNPEARPFRPSGSATPLRESVLRRAHVTSTNDSAALSPGLLEEGEEKEDVEMGEPASSLPVKADKSRKTVAEDREEGEASDDSGGIND